MSQSQDYRGLINLQDFQTTSGFTSGPAASRAVVVNLNVWKNHLQGLVNGLLDLTCMTRTPQASRQVPSAPPITLRPNGVCLSGTVYLWEDDLEKKIMQVMSEVLGPFKRESQGSSIHSTAKKVEGMVSTWALPFDSPGCFTSWGAIQPEGQSKVFKLCY